MANFFCKEPDNRHLGFVGVQFLSQLLSSLAVETAIDSMSVNGGGPGPIIPRLRAACGPQAVVCQALESILQPSHSDVSGLCVFCLYISRLLQGVWYLRDMQ